MRYGFVLVIVALVFASVAAPVFRWNLDAHPWSANAHDSLADALFDLGHEHEAESLLCRAVAIDPQYDRALERGLGCERTRSDAAGRDS